MKTRYLNEKLQVFEMIQYAVGLGRSSDLGQNSLYQVRDSAVFALIVPSFVTLYTLEMKITNET